MKEKQKKIIRPLGGAARSSRGSALGRFLYWLMAMLFFGVAVYMLLFSPYMAVSNIEVSGAETIGNEAVAKKAAAEMAGKYFNFLDKSNFIILSKKRVVSALKNEFIRIDAVEIEKNFPDGLKISVREKKMKVVLCSGENCFVVDDAGVAYAQADFSANQLGEKELPIVRDESGKTITQGAKVLPLDYINFLLDVRDKIRSSLGINLEREINTPGIASGDIRMAASAGWRILLDRSIPVEKETDMLRVALEKMSEEQRRNLDYVDLRINNKVYYRFK